MKPPKVSAAALKRIWEGDGYRLFLSHKSEVSKEVVRLKNKLKVYGVSAFVAHASIKPTQQWQDEIENGLHSMEALAALITDDFHDSNWTDQEVGFAFGRPVPVIPVRLGHNPRGFLARVQALSCNWENAAHRIVELLIVNDGMFTAYVQAIGATVPASVSMLAGPPGLPLGGRSTRPRSYHPSSLDCSSRNGYR